MTAREIEDHIKNLEGILEDGEDECPPDVDDMFWHQDEQLRLYNIEQEIIEYKTILTKKKMHNINIVNLMKKEPYDVYIGRANEGLGLEGSVFGNPFNMKNESQREGVIKLYRNYMLLNKHLILALKDLRGKTLGCYCKPKHCHGDVLVELYERFYDIETGELRQDVFDQHFETPPDPLRDKAVEMIKTLKSHGYKIDCFSWRSGDKQNGLATVDCDLAIDVTNYDGALIDPQLVKVEADPYDAKVGPKAQLTRLKFMLT